MSDETSAESPSALRNYGGIAVLVLAIVLAAVAAIWAFTREDEDSVSPGLLETHAPEVGEPAPDFGLVDGRDPDRIVRLSDFAGTPVVLNWYATWCGPCRAEIPDFQRAQDALGDDVVFLGVNLEESRSAAIDLMDDLGASYPVVLDEDGEIFAHYLFTVGGMPTTYFIDADGIIQIGGAGRVTEDALVDALALVGLDYDPPEEDS